MDKVCPVITLDNGIRIANWSSPHEFKFTTGEILPACAPERAKAMSLDIDETVVSNEKWKDIEISTNVPETVYNDLRELQHDDEIDIILIPFMVLNAIKDLGIIDGYYLDTGEADLEEIPSLFKLRVIRLADRVTKEIYPDKFCI